jgi:hypothetical protein
MKSDGLKHSGEQERRLETGQEREQRQTNKQNFGDKTKQTNRLANMKNNQQAKQETNKQANDK